jgi:hypothetical protein
MRREHEQPSTYSRVVELLSDGDWHCGQELSQVSTFPELWITELAHEGHEIKWTESGTRVVRLSRAVVG